VRVFVSDQEKRSPSVPNLYLRSCGGCGLGELPGSCYVEFLRELIVEVAASVSLQVRVCIVLAGTSEGLAGLVQEFLRELVVGIAAPSDLAGSIIVEILHSGKGGDVEQVAQTLK